jgi:hypothetical protein
MCRNNDKLDDNERHRLGHQARNEDHTARKAAEFGAHARPLHLPALGAHSAGFGCRFRASVPLQAQPSTAPASTLRPPLQGRWKAIGRLSNSVPGADFRRETRHAWASY